MQPEWFNNDINYAGKMRDKEKKLGHWINYKYWRNKVKQLIEKSKQKYYSDMVSNSKNPKTLWNCLKSLNPKQQTNPYELLKNGNEKSTDQKDIANEFNSFFTSCVHDIRGECANPSPNFEKLVEFTDRKISDDTKFIIPPVTINELCQDILNLDINKSTGTDNISPRIIKLCAPFISSPLTYIFNRIIDSGNFPQLLKNAKVLPSFKAGDRKLATNYRPISVLPTLSKLIEKHIVKYLYDFLNRFNFLHPAQSGFRPLHSCQAALINLIDKWLQDMDTGEMNIAILLDLRKAFDVVDHNVMAFMNKQLNYSNHTLIVAHSKFR